MPEVRRRVGTSPTQRGSVSGANCPDVFELEDGDFAVIGSLADAETLASLAKSGATIGLRERVVILHQQVLLDAMRDVLGDE